jgi:hypothetical protein
MPDSTPLATDTLDIPRVALREAHIQRTYATMQATQLARFNEWKRRVDEYAPNREYSLPRIHHIYDRALINDAQRDALHVTRKVLEAVTHHAFLGSQGWVAQFSHVTGEMELTITDELLPFPQTPGERSLRDCDKLLRQCAYNISEGPSFVRIPLILPKLEEKYYVTDLQTY